MTTKALNATLQRVIDRSEAQRQIRIAVMRAELLELGYSVVRTDWLNAILDGRTAASMRRGIGEAGR